jgi:transketolase
MKHDPQNPAAQNRDIFILSKGHAALAHYCILARSGYFPIDEVYAFGAHESNFGCHADRFKIPGIEASTGSLGHGIGLAVGVALASKLQKTGRQVYTLIGDGESNEGSVWESILVAANLRLNNLTIIYDNNMSHGRGLQITNPTDKLQAFGCNVIEVNGYDISQIQDALGLEVDGVKAIVANNIKGYGCQEMTQNHYAWHRRSPTEKELQIFLEELDAKTV